MPDPPPQRSPDVDVHGDAAVRIGRFVIASRLGQGAMGEVWSAHDPELDRRIALKRIRGTAGAARQQRLLREAQALARLSHPNVVQVFEAGVHDGEVYIAMEQVDGPTLRAWLGERTHTWRERLAMCMQAGRGLAAAHAVGLVHRDFKPDNVLLGRASPEQPWRARVADFGLARADEDPPPPAETVITADDGLLHADLTDTGTVLGTPAYMAPEQFLGTTVDARSDQFALCVVLFEALWGIRPFAGATRMALAHAITTGEVVPVPEGSGVPTWLHAAVLRGLATRPDARYASVDALLAELARDPARRKRRIAAAATLLAAACGAAWAVGDSDAPDPCAQSETRLDDVWSPTRRRALADHLATLTPNHDVPPSVLAGIDAYAGAWIRGHHDACVATHHSGEQTAAQLDRRMECLAVRRTALAVTLEVLAQADANAISHLDDTVAALPQLSTCADAEVLANQAAVPPQLRDAIASIEQDLARVRATVGMGRVAEGRALADGVEITARALHHAPTHAAALFERGRAEIAADAAQLARKTLEEAHFTALGVDSTELAVRSALSLVDLVGNQLADDAAAQQWIRTARSLVQRPGLDPMLAADLLQDEGVVHHSHGRYDAAQASFEAALAASASDTSERRDVRIHRITSNLGAVALAREDLVQAQYLFTGRLVADVARFGVDHLEAAIDLNNLGVVAFRRADFGMARAYFEQTLAIRRHWLGDDHTIVLSSLGNLAGAYLGEGDYEGAVAALRDEVAAWSRQGGDHRPEHDAALFNLGLVLRELGRAEESLAPTSEALQSQRRTLGEHHPATIASCLSLAQTHLVLDRPARARALLEPELDALDGIEITPYSRANFRFSAAQAIAATPGDAARADALATAAYEGTDDADLREAVRKWRARSRGALLPAGL